MPRGEVWCQVVDFPGHLRMRGKANDMLPEVIASRCFRGLGEARCIVYLVDADDKPKLKESEGSKLHGTCRKTRSLM